MPEYDPTVVVPECDCLETLDRPESEGGWKRPPEQPFTVHRRGCPRLAAIKKKWGVE